MVTTSKSQEIRDLFFRATALCQEAMVEADHVEAEVRDLCLQTVWGALDVIRPLVKLVDKPYNFGEVWPVRAIGFTLNGRPHFYSREGVIYSEVGKKTEMSVSYSLDTMTLVLFTQQTLLELAKVFADAMSKNEARHQQMLEAKKQLLEAAEAFKK